MNIKRKLLLILIFTLIFVGIVGIYTAIPTAPRMTPTSTRPIEQIVSDHDYLSECRELYHKSNRQAEFNGARPGVTTLTEVKSLLGEPVRYGNSSNYLEYSGYSLTFKDKIVQEIIVSNELAVNKSIGEILDEYSCPNAIFAIDPSEDNPNKNWERTIFSYYDNGLQVIFEQSFPVRLRDTPPQTILYFVPKSFEQYFAMMVPVGSGEKEILALTWSDAIVP